MTVAARPRVVEILLVEGEPCHGLTLEGIGDRPVEANLSVIHDAAEAIAFLRKAAANGLRPGLILLDFDLPGKGGRRVLSAVKTSRELSRIPVIVFSHSNSEEEVLMAYDLHANCYLAKPRDASELATVLERIKDFWLTSVRLPAG